MARGSETVRSRWRFWKDYTHGYKYAGTPEKKRNLVLASLDRSGFGWQIVCVAGFGFLTDAYDIFSINTIVPMISIVYWQNDFPTRYRLGMNLATLFGSMVGQVILGYLADRLGRRKVYGLELFFTMFASLGLATASSGAFGSMSLIGLLIFWRAVMGIGIGADYPLSAVITAESAPAAWRDSMLAAVFFCQPLGQLIAVLMAFAATTGMRANIANITATSGSLSCSVAATDPAAMECARTVDRTWRLVAGLGAVPALIAIYFRWTIPETVYYSLDVTKDVDEAMHDRKFFDPDDVDPDDGDDYDEGYSNGIAESSTLEPPQFRNRSIRTESIRNSAVPTEKTRGQSTSTNLAREGEAAGLLKGLYSHLFTDGNWRDLFATSLNWMLLDFTFYLLGVNSSSFIPTLFGENNGPDRPPYSLLVDEERHIMESSSVGSMLGCLIAVVVLLPRFKTGLTSPRKLQTWGFIVLAALFVIVGAMYMTLPTTNAHIAIVVFYELCQLFYNLGPNTTTFLIPAQSFPTRYRCFCYGISAAFGKLGSVLGQIVVTEVTNNKRLGGTLIGFTLVMLLGALSSWRITPETCNSDGASFELDDLGKGIAHRERLRKGEGKGVGKGAA